MTIFRYVSDLHGNEFIVPKSSKEEVLIIAGDVTEFGSKGGKLTDILKKYCELFNQVIYVPGNHCYYGTSILTFERKIEKLMVDHKNFTMLQNAKSITIDNTIVIGATLWSDSKKEAWRIRDVMNDYKYISVVDAKNSLSYRRLNPIITSEIHYSHVLALNTTIKEANKTGKEVIVVTHHLPTFNSVPERFKKDWVSCAYATDITLEEWPNYWIHGHTHDASNYVYNECNILCNPLGYYGENTGFDHFNNIIITK